MKEKYYYYCCLFMILLTSISIGIGIFLNGCNINQKKCLNYRTINGIIINYEIVEKVCKRMYFLFK